MGKNIFYVIFALWYLLVANTTFAKGRSQSRAERDDAELRAYFDKNMIRPIKTSNGVYCLITQKGTGDYAQAGQEISVNYTGKILDGKIFDSNVDEKYKHTGPFTFRLGTGMVIRGWDDALILFNTGCKGTIYIPSSMAYGPTSPGKGIPPNSILVFDIEVTDIDNNEQ